MKTNGILTLSPFRGKVKLKKSVHRVVDQHGAVIGGVSAYNVYDLNGEKIAGLSHVKKTASGDVRRYEGYRVFLVKDGYLTLENGGVLGRLVAHKERSAFIPVAVALSCVVAAILIIVIVLGFPEPLPVSGDERPVLTVRTDGEQWGANEDLQVFSGALAPGSEGDYAFEIENPTEYELEYTLTLTDENNWGGRSPLEYRLRMNNVYIGETNGWTAMDDTGNTIAFSQIFFAAGSSHIITIEWRWPFESGNDESDTQAGQHANGVYMLNIDITASIVGQE
ncbi:MAG TPA: hypothetical protein IAB64_02920 [Candidatus Coproplasma excrementavium]|nr:hypothetical protein [Candidatus Coproplasma excrementavium]